jgi:hypothetical protein
LNLDFAILLLAYGSLPSSLFPCSPFFAPRLELMAEILAFRQQLAILNRTAKRPSLSFQDRLFWVTLANAGRIGAPLFSSLNRRLSSNGIARGFGFIGAGN